MATDFRVVTPGDLGDTIVLGAKVPGKYDVQLPAGVTDITLDNKALKITTTAGEKTVDLAGIMPAVTAEVFLKAVERLDDKIQFIVGESDNNRHDTTFEVDITDLLAVVPDGVTISGNGTTTSKLAVRIASDVADNVLKSNANGLYVSKADVGAGAAPAARTVRLVNADGTQVLGYLYASEN